MVLKILFCIYFLSFVQNRPYVQIVLEGRALDNYIDGNTDVTFSK